ncbi:MAG: restriction endonuclease subunit S [Prevotella sp.]|nr:restriction endonuclease subunit S [Prevotella sp.]
MREGWTYKKLGEVCEILNGFAFKSDKYVEQGIRVLRITNVQKGAIVDNDPKYYPYDEESNIKQYMLNENDLLMSLTGNVGRVGLLQKGLLPAALNQRVACLRLLSDIALLKYLFHLLNSDRFEKDSIFNAAGIAQKNMSTEWLKKYVIPIPPLSEQQRIVSELDLLSSIIEMKKAQLKAYDQLSQSIFFDMFGDPVTNEKGWEVKRLSDVSLEKLSYGSGASAIPYNESVRYIRITDINENGELNEDMVSPNVYDEKYLLDEGDILFARSGATVGKTYCHKSKYGKCMYAGYLIRLVPNKDIVEPSYVFGYTKTSYYMGFVQKAQNAVAQPNINAKQYGSLLICIPPLSLQQSFASKIEAIEKQKSLVQQSIVETQTMFDYTMDKYFG